jgi:hypothetical protein
MANNNQKLQSVAALIFGIVFALVISEIILQLLDFPSRPVSGWLSCKNKHPGQCNALGYRGREISYLQNDFVVILVGDSEAYAPGIPFEQRPENRLEHFLKKHKDNVRVFTIADMGYGQDQQLLALKKYYKEYRADLVLLMFTARNDIEDNIFPTSGLNDTIKPTYWLENGELRGPTERMLEPVGPRLKLVLLWQRYVAKMIGESRLQMWQGDILPLPYQPLSYYEGEVDYSWHERWKTDTQNAYKRIWDEREGPTNQFTPKSELRDYGIDLTRKLLSEIKKLVEANKGRFIIFKEERPWELEERNGEKIYFLNGKYFKTSMKQYLNNLKDIFYGFEHYRVPLNMENYTLRPRDYHFNQEAIDRLMKEIAFIVSKKEYFRE